MSHSVAREKDGKSTTHKGKSKGNKNEKKWQKQWRQRQEWWQESVKGKGDPLKQSLVSRTQCRLCGEEGHWEEDCPQVDVDMPQAKRCVTFSRPPVGTGVFAILDCGAALDCIGEVAAARTAQAITVYVALQLWTKFNVSNLEVMAIRWRRRLL